MENVALKKKLDKIGVNLNTLKGKKQFLKSNSLEYSQFH
jgi:hypothetical protein